MKSYPSVSAWLKDQSPSHQVIIKALRNVIETASPKLEATVKWSNACWVLEGLPITYIYSDTHQVHIGFFIGSQLKDPKGLLEGNGKYVRYIKIGDKKEIDSVYTTKLIKAAMKIKYR